MCLGMCTAIGCLQTPSNSRLFYFFLFLLPRFVASWHLLYLMTWLRQAKTSQRTKEWRRTRHKAEKQKNSEPPNRTMAKLDSGLLMRNFLCAMHFRFDATLTWLVTQLVKSYSMTIFSSLHLRSVDHTHKHIPGNAFGLRRLYKNFSGCWLCDLMCDIFERNTFRTHRQTLKYLSLTAHTLLFHLTATESNFAVYPNTHTHRSNYSV